MNPYISDIDQFQLILDRAARVFKIGETLPSYVFNDGMSAPKFLEFAVFTTSEFVDLVKATANIFGDSSVYLLSQHPPAEDHETWYGRYGALEFNCPFSYKQYFSAITYAGASNNEIALFYSGVSMYIFGTSGDWGFFLDRDCDLIILSTRKNICEVDWPTSTLWLDKELVEDFLGTDMVVPYVEAFVKNYKLREMV